MNFLKLVIVKLIIAAREFPLAAFFAQKLVINTDYTFFRQFIP